MEFRQFFEIADFVNRDTSGIEFSKDYDERTLDDIEYDCRRSVPNEDDDEVLNQCIKEKLKFEVPTSFFRKFVLHGRNYKVDISHDMLDLLGSGFGRRLRSLGVDDRELRGYFKNVYDISLSGPSGFFLTGMNKGAEVYSQLLLTMKKFKEDYSLDGVTFSAWEASMSLVYDRFIRNFTDFQPVTDDGFYLSERVLKRIISKHPQVSEVLSMNREKNLSYLDKVRDQKAMNRKEELWFRGLLGKMVVFELFGEMTVGLVFGLTKTVYNNRLLGKVYYVGRDKRLKEISQAPENIRRLVDYPSLSGQYEDLRSAVIGAGIKVPGDMRAYTGVLFSERGDS